MAKTLFTSHLLILLIAILHLTETQAQYSVNSKATGVQLFQWKFTDIASECTNFLGPNGFSYVQTSPVQESISYNNDGLAYPWFISYQPIGYKYRKSLGHLGAVPKHGDDVQKRRRGCRCRHCAESFLRSDSDIHLGDEQWVRFWLREHRTDVAGKQSCGKTSPTLATPPAATSTTAFA